MIILLSITGIALILSFISDSGKTVSGIKKGLTMFLGILPSLLNILVIVSITLSVIPQETIVRLLGRESGTIGVSIAALVGSVSLIPGFIAFPLASILVKSGVSYNVTAVFITTLLMVGIITLPLEAKYFGIKTAIIRNILSLIGAVIVGVLIGVFM
jgi:uncharacterized membrane protein YraQ (UPF0718 family)